MRFHIRTLGCPKNEVDSEGIEALLVEAGHSPAERCEEADVVVVNTCGFIDTAREESLEALRSVASEKRPGSLLVAAGCLAQREGEGLASRVPGVNAVIGCRNWTDIVRLLARLPVGKGAAPATVATAMAGRLDLGTASRRPRGASAYLKIADGCDASCAFCAIPSIKGPYISKPADQVILEARQLVVGGVKEIILVAQDTTAYGLDRGERDGLERLLRWLAAEVPGLPWLRVMYLYPQRITPGLLRAFSELPKVVRYLDIPLQHTHPAVLKRMRRPVDDVGRLVGHLREALPEVAIRTTFIVGHPGETAQEHSHLLRSIERLKLDRVGVFAYSPQAGTPAAGMAGQVPEPVKQRRWRDAMKLARAVSLKRNRRLVGRTLEVLVEGTSAGDGQKNMAGRSYRDAPEVDGLVFFDGHAAAGEMVSVRITGALEYDLLGEMVTPHARVSRSDRAHPEREFAVASERRKGA